MLFTPLRLGALTLPNRVIMAPLTRQRAGAGDAPTALNALHYAQRASAGLIIAEASQVSLRGKGYMGTPGCHSPEQVAGWRLVTDAVHAAGGRIVLQLWHAGRRSHPSLLGGRLPISASAVQPSLPVRLPDGPQQPPVPHALTLDEIPGAIEDYRIGAATALAAGFDGIELHGANGYLIEQFLTDKANHRTDAYGGDRLRFMLEVVAAVTGVWGADRVGIRFSPFGHANDGGDSDPATTYSRAIRALNPLGLAFLHLIEPRVSGATDGDLDAASAAAVLRPLWNGPAIVAGGFDRAKSDAALADGTADAIAFGRPYISNPDLMERLRDGVPFAPYDRATFYGGGAEGYTDYPRYR
ncbi:MAG: alkene reductase [Rhodospirillales bacterium]